MDEPLIYGGPSYILKMFFFLIKGFFRVSICRDYLINCFDFISTSAQVDWMRCARDGARQTTLGGAWVQLSDYVQGGVVVDDGDVDGD